MPTENDNIIIRMFEWWNTAMSNASLLTADGFSSFYVPDARLVVNGQTRCTNLQEMAVHYRAIHDRCDEVRMLLPVLARFNTETNAFVFCRTFARVGQEESAEMAMAYADVVDGRMKLLEVISHAV